MPQIYFFWSFEDWNTYTMENKTGLTGLPDMEISPKFTNNLKMVVADKQVTGKKRWEISERLYTK